MSRVQKDGRILRSGVIKAAEIASGLGLGGPDADVRPTDKLTPAQQRAKQEGKPLPPSPEGYERVVIKGGRDAWEALGRPALEAPAGAPDGTPIPTITEPPREHRKAPVEALNGPSPEESAAEAAREVAEEVARTRAMAGEIARREAVRARAAMESGDKDRILRTTAQVAESENLVRTILNKLGGTE